MAKFTISALARAYASSSHGAPVVTEPAQLQILHGICSEDSCLDYMQPDETMDEVIVGGGRIRFEYLPDSNSFRVTTAYDVLRPLDTEERNQLIEDTVEQWKAGLGCGAFSNHLHEVLSVSLANAIRQTCGTEEELGDMFVDAAPILEDNDLRFEYDPDGSSSDDIIDDLITAAENGDLNALVMYAQHLELGDGVEQNEELAFELYSKAAEHDFPPGQAFAGYALLRGIGCDPDPANAIQLLTASANAGYPFAMHCLGQCYSQGIGTEVDYEKAFQYYQSGSEVNDAGCLAELGECYEFGRGTEIDLEKALECYQLASNLGFETVDEAIDRLSPQIENDDS